MKAFGRDSCSVCDGVWQEVSAFNFVCVLYSVVLAYVGKRFCIGC